MFGTHKRSQTPASEQAGRPQLEIQIHPSDIQKGVTYLFLRKGHLVALGLAALTYLGFLTFGLVVAPSVVGGLLSLREYSALQEVRDRMGQQLQGQQERFEELVELSSVLQLRMKKIHLAYGLVDEPSAGQGGYSQPRRELPETVFLGDLERLANLEHALEDQSLVLGSFLDEIALFEQEHQDQVRNTPSISPLQGDEFVLTSPFGTRSNPFTKQRDFHAGIDLAAPVGIPVYATADGQVNFASRYNARRNVSWWRYGNLVSIRHGDRFVTLYGHLDQIKVRQGQRVSQGDLIGTVGNTGWSTNPHLHYEVRHLDAEAQYKPVDPRIYILDHRWRDEEQLLVRGRSAPDVRDYEPLPSRMRR